MFQQLFPQRVDNTYRGCKLALWLFALVVLMKVLMSLNSIFINSVVASSADGIPLDTFTSAAAQTVVSRRPRPRACPGVNFRRTRPWIQATGEWRAEGLSPCQAI